MPVILFLPDEDSTVRKSKFLCPVYQTRDRAREISETGQNNNYVCGVLLNSEQSQLYWAERGAAMLCQPDQDYLL